MKYQLFFITLLLFLTVQVSFAQELKNNIGEEPQNKIDGITGTNDKMTVKDEDGNVLMEVTDEGEGGSVYLKPIPALNSNYSSRLYNIGTQLYWNGFELGTTESAGGWTDDGTFIYNSSLGDKVGIGIATPSAGLHVQNNDGVLFEGTFGFGTIPKEGEGTRMMWYPKKAAFRVGNTDSLWNDEFIGNYSTAMGRSHATRAYSTGMGRGWANGQGSTAMGFSYAKGDYSTAMGSSSAKGDYSTAMGSSSATGDYSTAMGGGFADSYYSTVVGRDNIGGGSATTWISTDPLFEIGNGMDDANRANALTVLKNGDTHINGKITSGNANVSLPIAYGVINTAGTVNNATSNVSSTWNSIDQRYEISISAESYSQTGYVGSVEVLGTNPLMSSTGNVDGKLLVYFFNTSGVNVQNAFHFVVYKL